MSEIRNSYIIDQSKKPVLTPFEADIMRYLHISDCSVIEKVWQNYWEYCPICHATVDNFGELYHRNKKEVMC